MKIENTQSMDVKVLAIAHSSSNYSKNVKKYQINSISQNIILSKQDLVMQFFTHRI